MFLSTCSGTSYIGNYSFYHNNFKEAEAKKKTAILEHILA